MDSTTFKKLVVFDVDLDSNSYKQEDRRYKDLPLVYSLFEQASKYQTVVIQTSGCLIDALDFALNLNIKKGYLIASGGAVIYDLTNKKVIDVLNIDSDDAQTIVHHGLMNNVNVGIYTTDRKFMYVANTVGYSIAKNTCYSHHEIIGSYDLLKETLSRSDIVDISYLMFLGSIDNVKQNKLLYNIDKYWEGEITNIIVKLNRTSNYVHISNKDATKLKAIQKVMSFANIEHLSDVLYVAATCANNECYITFKNSLVANNQDFLSEIGNKQHHYISDEIENLDPEFGLKTNSFWK